MTSKLDPKGGFGGELQAKKDAGTAWFHEEASRLRALACDADDLKAGMELLRRTAALDLLGQQLERDYDTLRDKPPLLGDE